MEMSTADPLRVRSRVSQNPVIVQTLCAPPPIASNKTPKRRARPDVSVEEEQERFVELVVPVETRHGQVLKVSLGLFISDVWLLPLLRYAHPALITTLSNSYYQECCEGCCDIIGDIICEYLGPMCQLADVLIPNQAARVRCSARETMVAVIPICSKSSSINTWTMVPIAHISFGERNHEPPRSVGLRHTLRKLSDIHKRSKVNADYSC